MFILTRLLYNQYTKVSRENPYLFWTVSEILHEILWMRVNEAKTGYTLNRSRTLEILWMRVNEAKTGYTLNRSRTLEILWMRVNEAKTGYS